MAKKFVRGITEIKDINKQDFDTNNVNDLLSDGQYSYIHRKKGKNEEYHNLTDNIKTISSDNTELLSVTNNNKTTNTATLHPKHDSQKEQVLQSTRNTVNIQHGTNGTAEKTKVDTNPQKVLEHENLVTDYGISKTTSGNTTTLEIEYTKVDDGFDLNTLKNGRVRSEKFLNSPLTDTYFFVSAFTGANITVQEAVKLYDTNTKYVRSCDNNVWREWREQVGDKSVINALLAQKEQLLESTRNTVNIQHGTNGTAEKTTVDTNPQKVLEHENLVTDNGISKITTGNTTKLVVVYSRVDGGCFDLDNLVNGKVRASDFVNAPATGWFFVSGYTEGDYAIQRATSLDHDNNKVWVRCKRSGTWGAWREQVGDKSVIDAAINANTEKINQLTARLTALEEKVAQLHPDS